MLQNNHLYRRIQHNNIFRTFSRAYTRQTYKQKPFNKFKTYKDNMYNLVNRSQSVNICQLTQNKRVNTFREQDHYKTISSINHDQNTLINSKSLLVSLNKNYGKIHSESNTNTIASCNMIEGNTWKKRNRQDIFKLKSCQVRNFDMYQAVQDGTQFSTIGQKVGQIEKGSAYRKQNKQCGKKEIGAYNFGNGTRGSFLLSKYCRFLNTAPNTKQSRQKRQKLKSQK